MRIVPEVGSRYLSAISVSLVGPSVLLPGGFFLAGIAFYGGDPGLGIAVVPVSAALLVAGVFAIARATAGIDGSVSEVGRSSSRKKKV